MVIEVKEEKTTAKEVEEVEAEEAVEVATKVPIKAIVEEIVAQAVDITFNEVMKGETKGA